MPTPHDDAPLTGLPPHALALIETAADFTGAALDTATAPEPGACDTDRIAADLRHALTALAELRAGTND